MSEFSSIKTKIEYSKVVNYAISQNQIPLFHAFQIHNLTEVDLHELQLNITSSPEFLIPFSICIDTLPAGINMNLCPLNILLSAEYLSSVTEKMSGILDVSITSPASTDVPLFSAKFPIDVLAFDEWSGANTQPDFLAAFATPNHPAIVDIMRKSSDILSNWTGNSSLDEYQSQDPNRVRQQAAAVYTALRELNIVYAVAPPSFESNGQRVRLCDTIFAQKIGNCLDLSLLYASCLEAIGLHPLVIVIEGHAFSGVWLTDEYFPESVQDDVSVISKRTAKGVSSICLVESTGMTNGSGMSFEEAEKAGMEHLNNPEKFHYAVDICRARIGKIKPLPVRIADGGRFIILAAEENKQASKAPANLKPVTDVKTSEKSQITKKDVWERKLLDMSLRNSLLNFKKGRSGIPILANDLDDIEDALAGGTEFQILPKPQDLINEAIPASRLEMGTMTSTMQQILVNDFSQKRMRANLVQADLEAGLKILYRKSKEAIEENGANVLYLALGFLKWYETEASTVARYAPIILLPVDILRKSASKGYVVRARDDESRMNITLLEMLKMNFGIVIPGLDPLPEDAAGIDTRLIFNRIRNSLMSMPRWDIVEESCIGIFSFNRFVMWNDIHSRSEDLEKNKIVKSLMTGRICFAQSELLPTEQDVKSKLNPENILLSSSADTSQLAAIYSAGEGQTFVLHGPPGTGKSQTITNIISNALAHNKTVLFVAEKMAALSVVETRLDAIGLSPFCLELHSNKATKRSVLDQLRIASEVTRVRSAADYLAEAKQLNQERDSLNLYAEALYHVWPFGISLYEAMSRYFHNNGQSGDIAFSSSFFASMDSSSLRLMQESADELIVAAAQVFPPDQHPLKRLQLTSYSFDLREKAGRELSDIMDRSLTCETNAAKVCVLLGLDTARTKFEDYQNLIELSRLLHADMYIPGELLCLQDLETGIPNDRILIGHCMNELILKKELRKKFREDVFQVDATGYLNKWHECETQWFLPKALGHSKIFKLLQSYAIPGSKFDKEQVLPVLTQLVTVAKDHAAYIPYVTHLSAIAGKFWKEEETDWNVVLTFFNQVEKINSIYHTLLKNNQLAHKGRVALNSLLSAGCSFFELREYEASYSVLTESMKNTQTLLAIDIFKLEGVTDQYCLMLYRSAKNWSENLSQLREWCMWMQARRQAFGLGLKPLVTAIESGCMQLEEYPMAYQKGLYKACISYIMSKDTNLSEFSGLLFEEKIRRFKLKAERLQEISRKETFARVSAGIPDFSHEAAQSSELGILKKGIKSNGRGLSIRSLFNQIPNLLPKLCPCMLMSPISVAQYLDPKTKSFDLVVYDEASQVPTSEAVGAIARGQNAIIVGDPKQLPPTSFFSSDTTDEENMDKEDLESILDDCLALSFPELHLKWHYRSRHESLITFSNVNYYENSLYTFPSPSNLVSKVQFVQVPGCYDRGGTRQNLSEGKAVVADIIRRLHDPILCKKSIGVVTFSSAQQNLIDDLLQEAFLNDTAAELAANNCFEPIFIKNLENVQGDERDIIMFSVGYGPDKNGHVTHNFGPLNRDGGWRRLNVAVTRARQEMTVFSTLLPEQLDLSRTSSEGVSGLKAFLEYAKKGSSGIAVRSEDAAVLYSGINDHIVKLLAEKGLKAQTSIGSSKYKVDVAIMHPQKPDEYILGLLCNGASYSTSHTASDREVLQNSVLMQLGWNLHHVWAVDWLENPEKECMRIVDKFNKLLEQESNPTSVQSEAKPKPPVSETNPIISAVKVSDLTTSVIAPNTATDANPQNAERQKEPVYQASPFVKEPVQGIQSDYLQPSTLQAQSVPLTNIVIPIGRETDQMKKVYTTVALRTENVTADDLCMYHAIAEIAEKMKQAIEVEGPISKSLLYRRVLHSYGLTRIGSRLDQVFASAAGMLRNQITKQNTSQFYWPTNLSPKDCNYFRIQASDNDRRVAEDLPVQEIVAAVIYILKIQFSMSQDDLVREISKVFGYSRLGPNVVGAIQAGIDYALKNRTISVENGMVVLFENKT